LTARADSAPAIFDNDRFDVNRYGKFAQRPLRTGGLQPFVRYCTLPDFCD
jgi:hypothetical protein